jgi:hypothetical protein
VSDYARKLGMAPGVMARNLLDLSEYNRRREPGLMLIEDKFDPMDRRIHRKFLTPRRSCAGWRNLPGYGKNEAGVACVMPALHFQARGRADPAGRFRL